MAEYEAKSVIDYRLYRKYKAGIIETAAWKVNQELAEKILNELEDGKTRLITLGPVQRIDYNTLNAVLFTRGVKIESLVRCQDCKHHRDLQYHYCTKWGKDCPDNSEFFCAWGERKEGEKDEC